LDQRQYREISCRSKRPDSSNLITVGTYIWTGFASGMENPGLISGNTERFPVGRNVQILVISCRSKRPDSRNVITVGTYIWTGFASGLENPGWISGNTERYPVGRNVQILVISCRSKRPDSRSLITVGTYIWTGFASGLENLGWISGNTKRYPVGRNVQILVISCRSKRPDSSNLTTVGTYIWTGFTSGLENPGWISGNTERYPVG